MNGRNYGPPNMLWDVSVAIGAGAVLASVAVLTWRVPVELRYIWPFLDLLYGLAIPGGLDVPGPGDVVTKFAVCWLTYAALVFVPFRIESLTPRATCRPGAGPRFRDSRVLRTSVPMLVLGSSLYYSFVGFDDIDVSSGFAQFAGDHVTSDFGTDQQNAFPFHLPF